MKLVRNKLNDSSAESCFKFEEQLNNISIVLPLLDVPAVGLSHEHL
jgi:hypothetical protein